MKPKGKRPPPAFSGRDALAYQQRAAAGDDAPEKHHVQKRQRAEKGLEVAFDPAGHKNYVTGFHKRKVQRRKEAHEKLETKAKQQRLEERKERREETRKRLQLDKHLAPELEAQRAERDQLAAGQPAAQRPKPAAVDMFDCDGVTTTVTTIALHSDDELPANGGASNSEDSSDGEPDAAAPAAAAAAASQSSEDEDSAGDGAGGFPAAPADAVADMTAGSGPGVESTDAANGATAAGGAHIDRGVVLRPSRADKRRRKRERVLKKKAKEQEKRGKRAGGKLGGELRGGGGGKPPKGPAKRAQELATAAARHGGVKKQRNAKYQNAKAKRQQRRAERAGAGQGA